LIAGGKPFFVNLKEENKFLIDLNDIPEDVAKQAKMFFINYPNNPTGAIAPKEFLQDVVQFCKQYNILLIYHKVQQHGSEYLLFFVFLNE
jgi:LL-diaminopimelate aminotransferase